MKRRYENYNHAKFKLRYHIILSVKYHKRMLNGIIDDVKASFARAESSSDGRWKIELVETDSKKDHHVHLLVKCRPHVSPSEIVGELKQISTYDMWKKNRQYMSKYFWNGKHYLWTRGYFCSTIGEVSEEKLSEYIKLQG